MFKHWIEILHEHDNGYLDWLFNQNVFPLRESASIMSGNGKGFKLEELFLDVHSLSSEQDFFSIQLKPFSKFSGWTFKHFCF